MKGKIKDYGGKRKAQAQRRKYKSYWGKYKLQIVLRVKIKCMTDKMKCEGRIKGLGEKIKSTRSMEENERLRGKKGADCAMGEIKCMRVIV